ncbi:Nucleotidylyl transferase [Biscogniauxia sp. FL1348]|nr:Nucleotidylyl transferase [Biscogniauxia sp. FL1348]
MSSSSPSSLTTMPSSASSPTGFPPNLVPFFAQALKNYQHSGSRFRVLCSLPAAAASSSSSSSPHRSDHQHRPPGDKDDSTALPPARPPRRPPRSLLILDSSFNPPTLAHQRMVLSAASSSSSPAPAPRILLLLAINNADKAPKPAAFPQRLAMMYVFARDLLDALATTTTTTTSAAAATASPQQDQSPEEGGGRHQKESESESESGAVVDIAVTTEPYFHAKSEAIAQSGFYHSAQATPSPTPSSEEQPTEEAPSPPPQQPPTTEQIFLAGFDTLVRIFDPKYYASASGMRAALDPFFARARLRVTARPGAVGGDDVAAQAGYLAGRAEASRVELVVERETGEVSSTLAREAARRADWDALRGLVGARMARWVRMEGGEGEGIYGGLEK